jgi:Ca2+/Na+ antiporter
MWKRLVFALSRKLFSIFHKNPAQTAYQLVIGITLALLAIKSGSIIPSVIYHFVNNLYIVTYYFLAPDGYAFDESVQIVLCVLGVIIYAVCLLYLLLKCKMPKADEQLDSDYAKISNKKQEIKYFLRFSAPSIAAWIILWVVNLLNV